MFVITAIYIFILGLAGGSFALAMTDRMIAGRDWVRGRSACDFCSKQLQVRDLLPVVSWLLAGGKCRFCRKKLSAAYPLVELMVGAVFVFSYLFFPLDFAQNAHYAVLALWLIAIVIMAALTLFDLRLFLLPNKLIYPLIGTAFVHRISSIIISNDSLAKSLAATGLALLVSAGLFAAMYVVSKHKWIGDGDVRLGVAMGLFLPGPLETWIAIFIASIVGMLTALPKLKKTKKGKMTIKIPFGPFLMLGLVVSYLFGAQLVNWYSRTFLYIN